MALKQSRVSLTSIGRDPWLRGTGSGKTTIGRAIIRINPTSSGEILYKGQRINGRISKELDRQVTSRSDDLSGSHGFP